MPKFTIYEFHAELDDFRPKIWRQFQVKSDITVARLGYIVQVLFEMTASHLMAFEVPRDENFRTYWRKNHPDLPSLESSPDDDVIWRYEIMHEDLPVFPDPYRNVETADAANTKLHHAIPHVGDKMQFNYDFGDDWWVNLTLEKAFVEENTPGSVFPRVLDGAGFGIVEDCGGAPGLEDLVLAFKAKKGEEYEMYRDWMGVEDFDITAFDLDDMNFRLKKIPRIYKQSYEDRLRPTKQEDTDMCNIDCKDWGVFEVNRL